MSKQFDLSTISVNPANPRKITDDKYQKLIKQIKDMPETLQYRPIVINKDNVIIAGNMRYRALLDLGYDKVNPDWVAKADDLTDEQVRKFIIIDNIGYGDHDWDMLHEQWDVDELEEWGLDVDNDGKIDKSEEGEVLEVEKSLQVLPKKEYIIIMADEDSEDWEELKTIFSCKLVRQGGCKVGSTSDKATTGLERVFDLKTFKERVLNGI